MSLFSSADMVGLPSRIWDLISRWNTKWLQMKDKSCITMPTVQIAAAQIAVVESHWGSSSVMDFTRGAAWLWGEG